MCSGTSSCGSATMPSGNSGKSRTTSPDIVFESTYPVLKWMTSTAIVWYRRDLRVHDHPALRAALDGHDRIVPVFVLDDALLHGRYESGARTAFMLGCLRALGAELRARGSGLVVRHGRPERELAALAREVGAGAVYWTSDVAPYARARDARVTAALLAPGAAGDAGAAVQAAARGSGCATASPRPSARPASRRRATRSRGSSRGRSTSTRGATTRPRAAPPSSRRTCAGAACRRVSARCGRGRAADPARQR